MHEKLRMLGFPVGSKVVMVGRDPACYVAKGEVGVVCHYATFSDGCNIGVEWEKSSPGRHDCRGYCRRGRGRYVPHTEIALLNLDLGELEMSECDFDFLLGINT